MFLNIELTPNSLFSITFLSKWCFSIDFIVIEVILYYFSGHKRLFYVYATSLGKSKDLLYTYCRTLGIIDFQDSLANTGSSW